VGFVSIDECCWSRTTGAIGGTGARGTSDRILQITEFAFEMTALLISVQQLYSGGADEVLMIVLAVVMTATTVTLLDLMVMTGSRW